MLKLKLQYFGHLMQRAHSLEKTLMLGKIEGRRRGATEDEMRWLDGIISSSPEQTPGDGEGQGGLVCCSPWGHKGSDTSKQQNNSLSLRRSLLLFHPVAFLTADPDSPASVSSLSLSHSRDSMQETSLVSLSFVKSDPNLHEGMCTQAEVP